MSIEKIPSKMKAWQFSSTSPSMQACMHLNESVPLPPTAKNLEPDTILIKVIAAGLSPLDCRFAEIPLLGRFITGRPSTPGMDFAGRVVASGPNTGKYVDADENLNPGQLVFGRLDGPSKYGTLADYTVARRNGCVALPKGVSPIDAVCATSVGVTAYWCIVHRLKSPEGKRVFINGGSGGTGTFGIQIAKAMGCHVTVSCSSADVEFCKDLGADVVIDYTNADLKAELRGKERFDLFIDNVGNPTEFSWLAPAYTNPGAHYIQVGPQAVTPMYILERNLKGCWPSWLGGGNGSYGLMYVDNNVEDYKQIGQWLEEGTIRAVVDEVVGFEGNEPVLAYEKLRTGEARGEIVVLVDDEWEE
ncbi:hypothetical protein BDV19DRAFT_398380 [Aspergillus venezuelensis]